MGIVQVSTKWDAYFKLKKKKKKKTVMVGGGCFSFIIYPKK